MPLLNTARRRILRALFHPISLRAFFINVVIVALIVYGFESLNFLVAFLTLILSYTLYYFVFVLVPTEILYSPGSQTAQRLLESIQCLKQGGYMCSFWTMNRHVNTVWAVLRPMPDTGRLGFHREVAHGVFADGENCVLDWYKAPAHLAEKAAHEWSHDLVQTFASTCQETPHGTSSAETLLEYMEHLKVMKQRHPDTAAAHGHLPKKNPVIVVFHGLTTAYGDANITRVVHALTRQGWDAVIPVRRGCGDDPSLVTKPKYYAYGGLEDTAITIEYIAKRVPDHPLFAVGFSAGSNVMVNYLGTQGRCSLLNGAVSFANGFCWQRGTETIEKKSPIWNVAMAMLWKSSVMHPHTKIMTVTHTYGVATGVNQNNNTNKSGSRASSSASTSSSTVAPAASNNMMNPASASSSTSSATSTLTGNANVDVIRPITDENRRNLADVDGNYEFATKGTRYISQDETELQQQEEREKERLRNLFTAAALKKKNDEEAALNKKKNQNIEKKHTLRGLASIREIDELISKEIHGFDSLDEFYAEQSCVHRLHRVKVPVIFCNALDDPIASGDNVPREAMKGNENFLAALTPRGGHLGWAQGFLPFGNFRRTRSFMDDLTIQGLRALMVEAKFRMRRFTMVSNNEAHTSAKLLMMNGGGGGGGARTNGFSSSPISEIPRNLLSSNHNNNTTKQNQQQQFSSTSSSSSSASSIKKEKHISNTTSDDKNGDALLSNKFLVPLNASDVMENTSGSNSANGKLGNNTEGGSSNMFLSSTSFDTNYLVNNNNGNGNSNQNSNNNATTPSRYHHHVSTPTMTIPREIALFPKIAKKQ